MGEKTQDVLFSENQFCSPSVWDLLRLTPWVFWPEIFTRRSSLCLLGFDWDLSPRFLPQDWQYMFYSSLPGLKGRFVCVWNCLIFSWANTHRLTWNLSRFVQNSVEILTWNFRKKPFRETFSKILCKQRLSSPETCEILPYFLKFYSRFVLRWKNSHKYFHMLFAPR